MRKSVAIMAGCLALVPAMARAAEPACIARGEFSALSAYALPSVISGAAKRCQQSLAPTAYLSRNGQSLAAGYATRKDAAWPVAKAAFFKLSNPAKDSKMELLAKLPDDSLREVVDVMVEGMVSQEIPLQKCSTIDRYVELLAPLPPENTADLIALTVAMVGDGKSGAPGKLKICQE